MTTVEVGFLEDLDVRSGFEAVKAGLPAGASFLVPRSTASATSRGWGRCARGCASWAWRRAARSAAAPSSRASPSTRSWGQDDFFTGFDELWVLARPDAGAKPEAIVLTSEAPVEPEPALTEWMHAGCLLGLGDGCGLNFATTDPALADALRAAARSSSA